MKLKPAFTFLMFLLLISCSQSPRYPYLDTDLDFELYRASVGASPVQEPVEIVGNQQRPKTRVKDAWILHVAVLERLM